MEEASASASTGTGTTFEKRYPDAAPIDDRDFTTMMMQQGAFEPFVVQTIKGKNMAFLLKVTYNDATEAFIQNIGRFHTHNIHADSAALEASTEAEREAKAIADSLQCTACISRLKLLLRLWGPRGNAFFQGSKSSPGVYELLRKRCTDKNVTSVTGIHCIPHASAFLAPLTSGVQEDTGKPYYHFTCEASQCSDKGISCDYWQRSANIYLPLLHKLMTDMSHPGIGESLQILLDALHAAAYGEKLIPAVAWFKEFVADGAYPTMTRGQKALQCVKALAQAPACSQTNIRANTSTPVCTFFHQFNKNAKSAMEVASSKEALESLLRDRFCPTSYMRTTAEPKQSHVQAAIESIGDFAVRVMTLSEVVKYGGKALAVRPAGTVSTSAAMRSLLKPKKYPKSAFGLAARVAANSDTMMSLWMNLKPEDTLEMYISSRDNDAAAAYTMEGGIVPIMNVPFLRQYIQQSISSAGGLKVGSWVPVTHMLPVRRSYDSAITQFILPLKGVRFWRQRKLPCYKEMVKTEYKKELGPVMEALQSKVVADVPDEPLAAGVGICRANASGDYVTKIHYKFRLNGREVIIKKFFNPKREPEDGGERGEEELVPDAAMATGGGGL